jgi:hypothetical protein
MGCKWEGKYKYCLRCGQEESYRHRLDWLDCPGICWICRKGPQDVGGHVGRVSLHCFTKLSVCLIRSYSLARGGRTFAKSLSGAVATTEISSLVRLSNRYTRRPMVARLKLHLLRIRGVKPQSTRTSVGEETVQPLHARPSPVRCVNLATALKATIDNVTSR